MIYRKRSNLNTLRKRPSQIISPFRLKIKLCWLSSWASKMSARSSPCTRSLKIISIWSNISGRSKKRREIMSKGPVFLRKIRIRRCPKYHRKALKKCYFRRHNCMGLMEEYLPKYRTFRAHSF
jgi:hypothetical protein